MTLITDTADLAAFCERQAGAEFVTVDTEFMRDKTYWPHALPGPDRRARRGGGDRRAGAGHRPRAALDLLTDPGSSRCSTPRGRTSKSSST